MGGQCNNNFFLLLQLLTVSTLDSKQTEELLIHYGNATSQTQGLMTMEDFAPIARLLLLMVYQNAYPGEASS